MKVHEVKIYESYADAVLSGEKTFEIRKNDRGYQKGDRLKFSVIQDAIGLHLPHYLNDKEYEITYVHSGLGMADGYVALAIKPLSTCRSCKFYYGVHHAQGVAACTKKNEMTLWNDRCDQFQTVKEGEQE